MNEMEQTGPKYLQFGKPNYPDYDFKQNCQDSLNSISSCQGSNYRIALGKLRSEF